ncbi:phosphoribosylglycinamide formyltransferase [Halopseudomonas salina]|uniref:Phosphoribosylglycinamide formyltransferase n=1 Tax=Halopseudomonas salina TaxID=1323744 RepID=A0ABQ1NZP9_9GAMM|nr:phosphoribosylglycinamide formyltransferase [Halopseudomonas salina]GGC86190.1 phosphoribosylglycinamide formyltransferase [Halopseudomonas salina]
MTCRILVLISGSGTNLQALIDGLRVNPDEGQIVAVISNRPDALGLERARKANIPAVVVDHRAYADRETYDQVLIEQIDQFEPDLILLAGFMRILTEKFVSRYRGFLLNIHPSLLPKHKGLHTHQRVLDAKEDEHGSTVHFVTQELDGGPLIVQARISVLPDDTPASLATRVQQQEHLLYPLAMRWFIEGRLRLVNDQACLDGSAIAPEGLSLEDFNNDLREDPYAS